MRGGGEGLKRGKSLHLKEQRTPPDNSVKRWRGLWTIIIVECFLRVGKGEGRVYSPVPLLNTIIINPIFLIINSHFAL
jgi:hypothetical protein